MDEKGFFGALFDVGFGSFITTKIISFIYIVGMIIAALAGIGSIIGGFAKGMATGIGSLILAPIVFLLVVVLSRLWCEMIIVLFKIADNTDKIAKKESGTQA